MISSWQTHIRLYFVCCSAHWISS